MLVALAAKLYANSVIDRRSTQSSCSWLRNGLRYTSITWFSRSAWPSVWGWKAVDMRILMPRVAMNTSQVAEVNLASLSEIMSWKSMESSNLSGKHPD